MAVFLFSVRLLVVLTIVFGGSSVVATERRQSFAGFGTSPHNYSGIPSGDYSTDWQNYFLVDNSLLPNVTFPLPRSFAGNIKTDRSGLPNNTLFFWGFEKDGQSGSLTAPAGDSNDPVIVWLNGGPGSSSMLGLLFEHGPIQIQNDYSAKPNNFSWNKQSDIFYVDQPVGTGFSTVESIGYVSDEDQMADDFVGFLRNLVKVFPSVGRRPVYLTGESYAGTYIPYIAKAIFALAGPPINLVKLAIGDGVLGSDAVIGELPTVSLIETYPQMINYDQEVYNYFKTQSHLCLYDVNLTYPTLATLPPISEFPPHSPQAPGGADLFLSNRRNLRNRKLKLPKALLSRMEKRSKRAVSSEVEKRNLIGRANGTLDPWYGCFLWEEMMAYALNFTFPWLHGTFDVYSIPDALSPEAPQDASVFLNDNRTRTALHAPLFEWVESINYPFMTAQQGNLYGDPSPEPMVFLSELSNSVPMVIYSGNDDSIVPHFGSEVVIQNMTFGGIQGFTRAPSTKWFNDDGQFAGIVHQERNVTYVLFQAAGHLVPNFQPENAYIFLREFVLGSNKTGLVTASSSSTVEVVGGETFPFNGDIMPGGDAIYFGAGTTQGSTVWPSATVDAWNEFLGLSTISASVLGSPTHSSLSTIAITGKSSTSAAAAITRSGMMRAGTIAIVMGLAFAIF